MAYNEITLLRKSGKLQEAYMLAKQELEAMMLKEPPRETSCCYLNSDTNSDPVFQSVKVINIELEHSLQNMAWVLYDLLKTNSKLQNYEIFKQYLLELRNLDLRHNDFFYDKLAWQIEIGRASCRERV